MPVIAFDVTLDHGARLRAHTRAVLDGEHGPPDTVVALRRLCVALVGELTVAASTVSLRSADGGEAVAAGSAEDVPYDVLEFNLGEGPGRDAFRLARPVLESDLDLAQGRWPGYAPAALRLGIGAVFAFPLHQGAVGFGALTLYAVGRRRLRPREVAECLVFAEVATGLLMDDSIGHPEEPAEPRLEDAMQIRSVVYQAQGMVMAELGISLAEALARMRAHAYAQDVDLNELAAEIVARRVRLDDNGPS